MSWATRDERTEFRASSTSFYLNSYLEALFKHCLYFSDMPGKSCPEGSAACLVTNQGSFNMGFPKKRLELLSNDRYLHGDEGCFL